jgi:hypothetical protein
MTQEFKQVEANDFLTFTPGTPAHVSIESALIEIGGGAKKGIEYKQLVMAGAGWKYKELTSYGAYAETAAKAFNRVREVLSKTNDKEDVLLQLKSMTKD